MNRRELLQGVGAVAVVATGGFAFVGGAAAGYTAMDALHTGKPAGVDGSKAGPYDAVGVLEAMTGHEWSVSLESFHAGCQHRWHAQFCPGADANGWPLPFKEYRAESLVAAVRWLHEQAAAADAEFAERWPVAE